MIKCNRLQSTYVYVGNVLIMEGIIFNMSDNLGVNSMILHSIMSTSEEDCITKLKRHLKDNNVEKKKRKKLVEHTERVVEISSKIVDVLGVDKYTKEIICRSAIFHDIAKFEDNEEHNKRAKKVLKRIFMEDEDLKKIFKIIEYHKGDFKPNRDIVIPSAVLRIADKLDKINKNKIVEFDNAYKSSMKKIKKTFKKYKIKDYKGFKNTCKIVKKQIKCNVKKEIYNMKHLIYY